VTKERTKERAKPAVAEILLPTLPLPELVRNHHLPVIEPLLDQWRQTQNVGHAFLVTGVEGIGKRETVYFLSQWLLCEKNSLPISAATEEPAALGLFGSKPAPQKTSAEASSTLPCNACPSCRSIAQGQAINFTEVRAEPSESGRSQTLKIDQFRSIKESQGFGAYQGRYRVFLITDADRMTGAAGNSLLKLLEEPPPGWIFFLTAADSSLVLPTLVSRCQKIRLRPFAQITLESLLLEAEVPALRRKTCAALAQGSWKRALRLASDEAWLKREELLQMLADPSSQLDRWVDWASQENERFVFLVDQLENLSHQFIRATLVSGTSTQSLEKGAAQTHFDRVLKTKRTPEEARAFWEHCANKLARARQTVGLPLNRKLVVQDLLYAWALAS